MTNATNKTPAEIAQELVDLRRRQVDLDTQARGLRDDLLRAATPGQTIQCTGGRVSVVDGGTITQLDPTALTQLLWERGVHLTVLDAEALIRDGKVERPREPYIAVRLE